MASPGADARGGAAVVPVPEPVAGEEGAGRPAIAATAGGRDGGGAGSAARPGAAAPAGIAGGPGGASGREAAAPRLAAGAVVREVAACPRCGVGTPGP
jgi:hypothetical protein